MCGPFPFSAEACRWPSLDVGIVDLVFCDGGSTLHVVGPVFQCSRGCRVVKRGCGVVGTAWSVVDDHAQHPTLRALEFG